MEKEDLNLLEQREIVTFYSEVSQTVLYFPLSVYAVWLRSKNGRNMCNRNGRELSISEAMAQTVKPLIRAKQGCPIE